jgi:hypothetical protein
MNDKQAFKNRNRKACFIFAQKRKYKTIFAQNQQVTNITPCKFSNLDVYLQKKFLHKTSCKSFRYPVQPAD